MPDESAMLHALERFRSAHFAYAEAMNTWAAESVAELIGGIGFPQRANGLRAVVERQDASQRLDSACRDFDAARMAYIRELLIETDTTPKED